jgi:hypothetical protein
LLVTDPLQLDHAARQPSKATSSIRTYQGESK